MTSTARPDGAATTAPADGAAVRLSPVTGSTSRRLPVTPATVDEALRAAAAWPPDLLPGQGDTVGLWELLATFAARDLAVARAVEPHLDALAILHQAGAAGTGATGRSTPTWGVFAAEMPTVRLDAARADDGTWRLTGTKPWCSLADRLGSALVTAHLPGPDGLRGLFAVDLTSPGVVVERQGWVARGLREIPSTPVRFDEVPAVLVRDAGWYLERPGFWWGAIGVAACWYGGAVGLGRRVLDQARRRPDDPLLALHLGAIDHRLSAARTVLADAADRVDRSGSRTAGGRLPEDPADRAAGRLLAKRVRAHVATTCEAVLTSASHALGPGPLTQEEDHAKRVADLQVYVRQQHAERDDVSLGRALVDGTESPW